MLSSGSSGVLKLLKTVNRTPSKRANPAAVPTQRKPSAVCSTVVTTLWGRPSRTRQVNRSYWVTGRWGSRATAGVAQLTSASTHSSNRRTGTSSLKGRKAPPFYTFER